MHPLIAGNTTVRDLVGRYPKTRKVFEQYGIDFCCGGATTLAEAARAKQVKFADLAAALQAVHRVARNRNGERRKGLVCGAPL